MWRNKNAFIFIFALIVTVNTNAQSIQSSIWSIDKFQNLQSGEFTSLQSSIILDYPTQLRWIQEDGQQVYTFAVVDSEGSWPDFSVDGEIKLDVTFGTNQGTVVFKKQNSVTTIGFDFPVDQVNSMPYRFNVTSVATP